jgi:hypothetical protein
LSQSSIRSAPPSCAALQEASDVAHISRVIFSMVAKIRRKVPIKKAHRMDALLLKLFSE